MDLIYMFLALTLFAMVTVVCIGFWVVAGMLIYDFVSYLKRK